MKTKIKNLYREIKKGLMCSKSNIMKNIKLKLDKPLALNLANKFNTNAVILSIMLNPWYEKLLHPALAKYLISVDIKVVLIIYMGILLGASMNLKEEKGKRTCTVLSYVIETIALGLLHSTIICISTYILMPLLFYPTLGVENINVLELDRNIKLWEINNIIKIDTFNIYYITLWLTHSKYYTWQNQVGLMGYVGIMSLSAGLIMIAGVITFALI